MNKIDAPDRFAAEGKDGADWSYGTSIERPLDAPASEAQQVDNPGGDTAPPAARVEAGDRGETPPDQGSAKAEQADWRDGGEANGQASDAHATPNETDEAPPSPPRKRVFVVVGLILVGLLAWGAYGHWSRDSAAEATRTDTQNAVPEVRTSEAKRDDKPIDTTLPGQTEAFETASIFARATGYITQRHVDIGTRVKKGELLVHISAPDLDQQLAQAVAQLGQVKAAEAQADAQVKQAEANLTLAKLTLARAATLTQQGYETVQNRDNQTANQQSQEANVDVAHAGVKVAEANTQAQQATVDRLKALTGFEDVMAPFDGVITVRNIDNGDLVNADTSSSTPMFSIAREDVIRVTVQVPQNASAGVRDGVPASIEVPSNPGQQFSGSVTRSSVALLSSARTLDTEVDVANPDGAIRPGLFVYVTMHIPRDHPEVMVPAEALIFNKDGMQVATVADDKVRLQTVTIDRDFGTAVSVSAGLSGGETLVLSPPMLLHDGSKVKAKKAEEQPAKGDGGAPKADGAAPKAESGEQSDGKAKPADSKQD